VLAGTPPSRDEAPGPCAHSVETHSTDNAGVVSVLRCGQQPVNQWARTRSPA
jgi:hypothetical protein